MIIKTLFMPGDTVGYDTSRAGSVAGRITSTDINIGSDGKVAILHNILSGDDNDQIREEYLLPTRGNSKTIETLYKPGDVVGYSTSWQGAVTGTITSTDIHIWANGSATVLHKIQSGKWNAQREEKDISPLAPKGDEARLDGSAPCKEETSAQPAYCELQHPTRQDMSAEIARLSAEVERLSASRKYRVSVQKMVESHRETWWVCLDNPDRPLDAKPWDEGRMTPYMSEDKAKADFIASEWAQFFGVTVATNG